MVTFAHDLFLRDDQQLNWTKLDVDLEQDRANASPLSGNTLMQGVNSALWLKDIRYGIVSKHLAVLLQWTINQESFLTQNKQMSIILWKARW